MADTSIELADLSDAAFAADRVWVLDDPRERASTQAIGIAERLGLPFRRVALSWNGLSPLAAVPPAGSLLGLRPLRGGEGETHTGLPFREPGGSGPALTISAGWRAAAVALWLQQRFGTRTVHCTRPPLHGWRFDLLVVGQHDRVPEWPNAFPVLGVPHRLSVFALCQAVAAWETRLAHLPQPRITLLVGGPMHGTDMVPAVAHGLGVRVAALARQRGGSVLAMTSRRTGDEATAALAAGLSSAMHLLHRRGEPGEDPYSGFLACADAIVVTGDSIGRLSEACATSVPVFIALPELGGARQRRLHAALIAAEAARPLTDGLPSWPRRPLDEAARVAQEIMHRFLLDLNRVD